MTSPTDSHLHLNPPRHHVNDMKHYRVKTMIAGELLKGNRLEEKDTGRARDPPAKHDVNSGRLTKEPPEVV